MSRDPFAPPEDPQVDLSLDRPAVVPGTAAPEHPIPRAPRQKPRTRRPSSTPWVVWALAALGGVALFGMVTRALKQTVEGQTATPSPTPAVEPVPTWKPVATGEGVLIDVRIVPRAARLFVDGAPAASNPLRLPRGTTRHELSATAEGYEPAHRVITAERAQTIELRLTKRGP